MSEPASTPAAPPSAPRATVRPRRRRPPPPPVRLLPAQVSSPFAPGREVVLARLAGRRLERAGLREGDHVALARRDRAPSGALAAVAGALRDDPSASLWLVYPEGSRLRVSCGAPDDARRAPKGARVQGIVVGVLRKLGE